MGEKVQFIREGELNALYSFEGEGAEKKEGGPYPKEGVQVNIKQLAFVRVADASVR